ncbi:MAG: RNA 2',3'-cyclic phosphodiesterase [Nitrososphaeria archaeon]|nr:RNA 2',3'-cyclic phosphodiesterase [Conexivisphaerales archaeon]
MRAFVSVNIEDKALKGRIREIAETIKDKESGISITKEENLHFTLKFLGEINENQKNEIVKKLSKISLPSFDIHIKGLGVFPDFNFVRIIWIGGHSNELKQLAEEVNKSSSDIKSDEEFVPHLTIARVKFIKDKESLKQRLNRFLNIDLGSYRIKKFYLMESTLLPEGPLYKTVSEFNLF